MRKLTLMVVLVAGAALANPPKTFAKGSLIIPMQATYQSECGTAAAYGLVWSLLYENRPGGYFDLNGGPITVYWALSGTKASPNRCVPSNKHVLVQTPNSGVWSDPQWNDGCDFKITNTTPGEQPVVPVPYTVPYPPTGVYPNADVPDFTTTSSDARPYFTAQTLTAAAGFTDVQYMGAPFLIDAPDAKRVIEAMNSVPQLQRYKKTSGTVTRYSTNPSTGVISSATDTVVACGGLGDNNWYVYMHQATVQFDAPVYKRINKTPPKVAVLNSGGGVSGGILTEYLHNAGLDGISGGQGTFTYAGILYDTLDTTDLSTAVGYPNGKLNAIVAGKSRYKVFWAPHWDIGNTSEFTAAKKTEALENIAFFADKKGNGLMAECASLETYEGSWEGGSVKIAASSPNTAFQFTAGIDINGLSTSTNWPAWNCTDPDYLASASPRPKCTRYLAPEEPFAQIGDFAFSNQSGHVKQYRVHSAGSSARRATMKRMATSWVNWTSGTDDTGDNGWDFFSLGQKDDDPEKATVLYLAGHKYMSNVAGQRVVLNTLLNLGADPIPSDRAMATGVGYYDPNTSTTDLFTSIYTVVTGTLLPGTITLSNGANAKNWLYPFNRGDLRAQVAVGTGELSTGQNELNDALLWSAEQKMPLPADRNLFTYFGGDVVESPALSGGRKVKNDIVQMGWVAGSIDWNNINGNFSDDGDECATPPCGDVSGYPGAQNATCTDVLKFDEYKDKAWGKKGGLVAGPDGLCDLQQVLQLQQIAWSTGGGKNKLPQGQLKKWKDNVPWARQLVQMIRGYCYAEDGSGNPLMEPTDAECVNFDAQSDNRAHMGGLVHSSAAIVPRSPNIPPATANKDRPTVAYVAGWDGQLHAIYVSGGSGYTGPAVGASFLNGGAAPTFKTNYAADFAAGTLPDPGTELWSYMPATQLPWAKTNAAIIDSSPVVQDVFIDTDGSGIRKWHTVVVVSLGGNARELFAMDVTNPLKPVLLWDIVGSNYQVGSFPDYPSAARPDVTLTGAAQPLVWYNPTATYELPPTADPASEPGLGIGAAYDYSELGGSRALSIGQMREGLLPTYAVFVASNSSGEAKAGETDDTKKAPPKGLVVYAIDIGTGQKLWQWMQPYAGGIGADNTVPPPVSVLQGLDGAATLFVGDMEGRIWQLDARSGQSMTVVRDGASCSPLCNYAAFDTRSTAVAPQPITSNLAVAKLPQAPSGYLANYGGEQVLVVATAGADWVPGTEGGKVHFLLLNNNRRKPVIAGGFHLDGSPWTLVDARASAAASLAESGGVLQNPDFLPYSLTAPQRVYGNITIAGQSALVPIVDGVGGDPLSVSSTIGGKVLNIDLGDLAADPYSYEVPGFSLASFGGPTVVTQDLGGGNTRVRIVGPEIGKTTVWEQSGASPPTMPKSSLSSNESLPYRLYNAVRRFLSQQ